MAQCFPVGLPAAETRPLLVLTLFSFASFKLSAWLLQSAKPAFPTQLRTGSEQFSDPIEVSILCFSGRCGARPWPDRAESWDGWSTLVVRSALRLKREGQDQADRVEPRLETYVPRASTVSTAMGGEPVPHDGFGSDFALRFHLGGPSKKKKYAVGFACPPRSALDLAQPDSRSLAFAVIFLCSCCCRARTARCS